MDDSRFVESIAAAHGCPADLARTLMTECLAALHEVSYKYGTAASVEAAHAELGGLAAWHLMGLVVDAADAGDPGSLVRAYTKVEPDPAQFDAIAQAWDGETGSGR
jgi:hypothetical protein